MVIKGRFPRAIFPTHNLHQHPLVLALGPLQVLLIQGRRGFDIKEVHKGEGRSTSVFGLKASSKEGHAPTLTSLPDGHLVHFGWSEGGGRHCLGCEFGEEGLLGPAREGEEGKGGGGFEEQERWGVGCRGGEGEERGLCVGCVPRVRRRFPMHGQEVYLLFSYL